MGTVIEPETVPVTRERWLREAATFFRFGLTGVPGFVLAIGLNILLVERFHWPKPLAYLLVVWMQMTSGFVMCRFVVFNQEARVPLVGAYFQFAFSMGVIRLADWSLYTFAVAVCRVPYLAAQISLTALFIGLKFISAKAIFRGRVRFSSKENQ